MLDVLDFEYAININMTMTKVTKKIKQSLKRVLPSLFFFFFITSAVTKSQARNYLFSDLSHLSIEAICGKYDISQEKSFVVEYKSGIRKLKFEFHPVGKSVIRYFYPNGRLKMLAYVKEGELHGEAKTFFINGSIASIAFYKKGKLYGYALEYYQSGAKKMEVSFDDSIAVGVIKGYYEDSSIKFKSTPINENNVYKINFYSKYGKLVKEEEYFGDLRHGASIVYYSSGQMKQKAYFKNDKYEGPYFSYYQDEKIKESVLYVDGKKEGIFFNYYPNGAVKLKSEYEAGLLEGSSVGYYSNSAVAFRENMAKNKIIGKKITYSVSRAIESISYFSPYKATSTIYYSNGNIRLELIFHSINGSYKMKSFREDGSLKFKVSYANGNNAFIKLAYYQGEKKVFSDFRVIKKVSYKADSADKLNFTNLTDIVLASFKSSKPSKDKQYLLEIYDFLDHERAVLVNLLTTKSSKYYLTMK